MVYEFQLLFDVDLGKSVAGCQDDRKSLAHFDLTPGGQLDLPGSTFFTGTHGDQLWLLFETKTWTEGRSVDFPSPSKLASSSGTCSILTITTGLLRLFLPITTMGRPRTPGA